MTRFLILLSLLPAINVRAADVSPLWLCDIDGHAQTIARAESRATAVIFLGTQCPISNRAVPTLNAIYAKHKADGVDFLGVVSDPTVTRVDVAKFRDDYKIAFPIVIDADGSLAKAFAPKATPDAFVISLAGSIVYRGRIDNTFASLGQVKQSAHENDLADAIDQTLAGKAVVIPETKSVGCLFEAWNAKGISTAVTYNRDIAPILAANCVSCHREGQIAPFSLMSYADAAKRAKLLATVTESRYMPPWKPHEDFNHFVGEHRLSDDQIKLIGTWADAGAPEGSEKDAQPMPTFSDEWRLGKPDLVVKMAEPYTVPAGGKDIYRAFVLPLNLPNDSFVAGVEFRPGAPTVVHHAIFYLDTTGAARKKDEADPEPGYKSFGGPGFTPTGGLGGWAPGAEPPMLPDGVGRYVRGGSDLVIQMHYHPDGRERKDQSSVAIYLQKKPIQKVIGSLALTTRDIDIAPGDANYTRSVSFTLPMDVTLSGATPHMHLIGHDMKVAATEPDGKVVPIIQIDDWDFKWQGQYRFVEPITLPKGTKLDLVAHYDNSTSNANNPNDPPQRIHHGEQTTDEMCFCFLEYEANSAAQMREIRQQVARPMMLQSLGGGGGLLRSLLGGGK